MLTAGAAVERKTASYLFGGVSHTDGKLECLAWLIKMD